jgi:hypothetical protein
MTSEYNHLFRQMYIEKLDKKNIYQIISPEFKGIGVITNHNQNYTRMIPHTDEELEKDWPEAGVTYPVFIPTADIKLIITLREGKTKENKPNERL